MTVASFIEFTLTHTTASGKTSVWKAWSKENGVELGTVRWYANWRKYVFEPCAGTLFDCKCLQNIQDFITSEMQKHRSTWKTSVTED